MNETKDIQESSQSAASPFKYIKYYVNLGSKVFMVLVMLVVCSAYFATFESLLFKAIVAISGFAYALRIIPWEKLESGFRFR